MVDSGQESTSGGCDCTRMPSQLALEGSVTDGHMACVICPGGLSRPGLGTLHPRAKLKGRKGDSVHPGEGAERLPHPVGTWGTITPLSPVPAHDHTRRPGDGKTL